ncbi:hypothetical protein MXB_310, partial [Myxobolus squamalis]
MITFEELKTTISALDDSSAINEARTVIETYDKKNDASLSLEEFLSYKLAEDSRSSTEYNTKVFQLTDQDHSGAVSATELAHALQPKPGSALYQLVVSNAFEEMDTDHNGKLSIEEYYEDDPDVTDADKDHFKTFLDKNDDGFLDLNEYSAMHTADEELHIKHWVDDIFSEVDKNKDQKISEKEFVENYEAIKSHLDVQEPDYEDYASDHEDL